MLISKMFPEIQANEHKHIFIIVKHDKIVCVFKRYQCRDAAATLLMYVHRQAVSSTRFYR